MNTEHLKKMLIKTTTGAALALGLAAQANANFILIDNLDQTPLDYWNSGSEIGQAFTTGLAVTINSATFLHDYGNYAPTPKAHLTIQKADFDGKIGWTPSDILDTWTVSSDVDNLITFSGDLLLAPDTRYWLVLHDTESQVARVSGTVDYLANFGASLPEENNNYESFEGGQYWDKSNGPLMFQVTTVPDGGTTLVLLGGALTGLGALRRKFSA
ncbi:MAG: VPDSG-CTERM sorting domain-containing protein [Verrucomicrobia bacterium]|nr:VPDSG-CTERM sorting domain-containing protein [Verrucomicrobiota bacterium]